jgi:hypothetical protein
MERSFPAPTEFLGSMRRDIFERRPIVLLVALVLLFFWKLAFSNQFTFLDSPDLAFQVLPWYQVQARSWNQGVFPMWDPYQWGGQSLLGQVQPGAAFPLNWPLFLAPLDDGYIDLRYIHWHYVLMHVLAGLFLYALARKLGRSRYASLLAGLAFSFAGHIGSINWPQMLNGAIWLPLVFLFFHEAEEAGWGLRGVTFATLCGGAAGMALLSGHHQAPTFMLLALTGLFFYFLYQRRQSAASAVRFSGLFAFIALVTFVISALQLLPAFEYARESYRWVGAPAPVSFDQPVPYYVQYPLRVYPVSLLGMVIPTLHFEANTFMGVVCVTMAVLGLAACWRERWVRVYAGLAAAALAYGFGPYSILHGWIYNFIPMADKARHAGHAVYVFQFAVIVLAAHGVDRLLQTTDTDQVRQRWLGYVQRALLGFALMTWIFLFHAAVNARMGASEDRFMIATLVALALAGLIHGLRRESVSLFMVRAVILLLMIFELYAPNWYYILHRSNPETGGYLAKLKEMRGPLEFLKSQPGPFRYMKRSEENTPNYGSWEGIESADGYLASVSKDLYEFFSKDWYQRRLMMNTVYILSKEKALPEEVEVFSDPSGWKIYRNPNAKPRAWIEHTRASIAQPAGEGRTPPASACEGQEEVSVTRHSMHRMALKARLACPAYVVVAEAYYPGWKATVDDEPATVYRAYGALRALYLQAGEHEMEFAFRPASVYWGGALTAIGFAACLVLAAVGWRRGFFAPEAEINAESEPRA